MTKASRLPGAADAFTLVEVMVASSLGAFLLAGILTANLQIIRGGVRITHYAEMESQVRRGLDTLGRDLREALEFTWNGESDITLVIPTSATTTATVTYAWTADSRSFFRVAGASSAEVNGRLELVRGIPPQAGGEAGVTFARFDRDGAAVSTDDATKIVLVTMSVVRAAQTVASSRRQISATFALRNKPTT
jgi:Tfp pilus assembly protein PilW